jgi:HEAT repeat protein
MENASKIEALVKQLSSKDGDARQKARLALVDIGQEATQPLTALLTDKDKQTRWEAAKVLGAINDPAAIPALIEALKDDVFDVRWLVSEALVHLGTAAVIPVLDMTIVSSDKLFLREEAHHVLKYIMRDNPKNKALIDIIKPVTNALESSTPAVSTPAAAKIAIAKMKELPDAG